MHPPTWEQASTLIEASSSFVWPLTVVAVAMLFRDPIGRLIDRIRFFRIPGADVHADLRDFEMKVANVERAAPSEVGTEPPTDLPASESGSPLEDMVLIAIEVERLMREIHTAKGLGSNKYRSTRQLIRDLVTAEVFTEDMPAAIDDFWAIRNRALHGEVVAEGVLRESALLGRRILRVLQSEVTKLKSQHSGS